MNQKQENKEPKKDKIKERISELQRELQMHQLRLNQIQQIINEETKQILAKQGAILELMKFVDESLDKVKDKKV